MKIKLALVALISLAFALPAFGKTHADYDVKHAAHVTITGAILQRQNHVTLVPSGAACEMQVVSNFSGWEHSDRGDFKKRVDESLVKLKNAPPAQPAEPEPPK